MRTNLELMLQEKFPFMKRDMNASKDEQIHNIYQKWGCECNAGWYQLIYELCQEISDRYAEEEIPVDLVVEQIKQKFASLRFYYSFADAPLKLQAFDCVGGPSIRFYPENDNDDDNYKKLRNDIASIVRKYEEKSKTVCEICGQEGTIRMDMPWKRTLCDECYGAYLKKLEEKKKK